MVSSFIRNSLPWSSTETKKLVFAFKTVLAEIAYKICGQFIFLWGATEIAKDNFLIVNDKELEFR